ncbi:MAG: hypothetical protein WA804_20310, partial [Terriglobales bacterium]
MDTPPVTQGTPTVQPPPGAEDKYDQSGKDKFLSILNAATGGGNKAIMRQLDEDHQRKLIDIGKAKEDAQKYLELATRARATGKNPITGQPVTPEDLKQWDQLHDNSMAQYGKLTGTSKESKGIFKKMQAVAGHVMGRGQVQPPPGAGGGGGASAAAPAASATPQATVPPPPGAASANPAPQMD